MKTLIVDLSRCNGCHACQIACKDEHCGQSWMPYAAEQPMAGQFWCRVDERERGRVPVVRVQYTPRFCGHCDDAPCMDAAKDGAVYRRDDGIVIIDPEKAVGQKAIADACPHGVIFWNEEKALPQKCTGCAHLLDDGWEVPRCVDVCATGALRYGEPQELGISRADLSEPEGLEGMGSHALYMNAPKRWIAGTVAVRAVNEVVVGADVSVLDEHDAVVANIKTDEFGDFRWYDANEERYSVRICVDGYEPYVLEADCTQRDVVFDDVLIDQVGVLA